MLLLEKKQALILLWDSTHLTWCRCPTFSKAVALRWKIPFRSIHHQSACSSAFPAEQLVVFVFVFFPVNENINSCNANCYKKDWELHFMAFSRVVAEAPTDEICIGVGACFLCPHPTESPQLPPLPDPQARFDLMGHSLLSFHGYSQAQQCFMENEEVALVFLIPALYWL